MSTEEKSVGQAGVKRPATETTNDTPSTAHSSNPSVDEAANPSKRRRFGPAGDSAETELPQAPAPSVSPGAPATSTSILVQQAREKAQALLAKRQAAMAASAPPAQTTAPAPAPAAVPQQPTTTSTLPAVTGAQDALARIKELQAKMAAQKAAAAAAAVITPIPTPSQVPPASTVEAPVTPGVVYVSSADEIQPVRFDAQGRPLDAFGNIIEIAPRHKGLGGDKKKAQAAKPAAPAAPPKEKEKPKEKPKEKEEISTQYFDPSLSGVSRSRRKAMFQLVAAGEYSRQAAAMRMKRASILLESASAEAKARKEARDESYVDWTCGVLGGSTGIERAGAASVFALSGGCEWWDQTLLKNGSVVVQQMPPPQVIPYPTVTEQGFESEDGPISATSPAFTEYFKQLYTKTQATPGSAPTTTTSASAVWPIPHITSANTISHLVHFPRRLAPVIPPPIAKAISVMLTKEERKKARRQRRMAAERDKQDLIRAGLIPAPEPRIKLSNLTRVLGTAMVGDPTALEAKAKAQMAARVQKHIEHNLATMLTAEQRKEKLVKKYTEDTEHEVHIAVFRCGSLLSGKAKFKVGTGAKELYLTGIAMMNPKGNVVVVEGGPKAIKRYTALMIRRMKWDAMDENEEEQQPDSTAADAEGRQYDGASPHKDCQLVWSGTLTKRLFKNFRFENSASKTEAREKMASQGAAQYWDLAQSFF